MAHTKAERSAINETKGAPGILSLLLASSKPRIAVAASLSALPGYALAAKHALFTGTPALTTLLGGVFLLSSGAGLLNNLQDRTLDRTSDRTRSRPLPSGLLAPSPATAFAALLLVTGAALLFHTFGALTALLGSLAVLLYNGVYTPLKRLTWLALIPGSLVGAIPPLMGHAAAGGSWEGGTAYLLAGFYLIWQIPHTFLIYLMHGDSFTFPSAPTLRNRMGDRSLGRITLVWIWASAVSALAFPLVPEGLPVTASLWILGCVLWLVYSSGRLAGMVVTGRSYSDERNEVIRPLFVRLNLFSVAVGMILFFTKVLPL